MPSTEQVLDRLACYADQHLPAAAASDLRRLRDVGQSEDDVTAWALMKADDYVDHPDSVVRCIGWALRAAALDGDDHDNAEVSMYREAQAAKATPAPLEDRRYTLTAEDGTEFLVTEDELRRLRGDG
jgi:hypothetical protein